MADRRRRGRWLLLAAAGAAALTVAVALGGRGGPTAGDPAGRPADLGRIAAAFSDKLPQPGPAVVTLTGADGAARWAPVLRAAAAHRLPERTSPVVATVSTRTPEGTDNLVLALVQRRTGDGNVWVKVRLPILPNGSTGWIDRDLLGAYHRVRTRLVVDRARRTATLTRDGRVVFRTRVGVGRPYWPTPAGSFYVRDRLTRFASPFYGPIAFGTSARSAVLTDWPGGGFIGIHGTDQPGLLPGAVSHGCIRMRNAAILRLARLMPVGTPVRIV